MTLQLFIPPFASEIIASALAAYNAQIAYWFTHPHEADKWLGWEATQWEGCEHLGLAFNKPPPTIANSGDISGWVMADWEFPGGITGKQLDQLRIAFKKKFPGAKLMAYDRYQHMWPPDHWGTWEQNRLRALALRPDVRQYDGYCPEIYPLSDTQPVLEHIDTSLTLASVAAGGSPSHGCVLIPCVSPFMPQAHVIPVNLAVERIRIKHLLATNPDCFGFMCWWSDSLFPNRQMSKAQQVAVADYLKMVRDVEMEVN